MPPRLVLQFLGLPQIYLDDQPVVTDRRKAIALLAYLVVNDIGYPHQRYTRESLSTLLWPDYEQAKAFSNLRRTIWEVHQALGENWLIADRESVRLNPGAEIDLDVSHFQDLLSQAHQQGEISFRIPLLVDAFKLYRNHFLTGFSLKDAYPFNEWAFTESEELRHKLADALTLLSEDYCAQGQPDKAIPYARRLTALDPLNESTHRQLMDVYMQAGQHSEALKQYKTCEQILRKELNLDPQPETRALYKKIRKREITPVRVEKQTDIFTPRHNLPSQLSTFIGREKEQGEIINLIAKNRLVTLLGVGGIGKTRLALQVGQKLLNNYLDGVWFIPLDSLSDPALVPQAVASVFDIREGPDLPATKILMNVLREKTVLLILDNCEHLLDSCAQLITTLLTNCPNLKMLATSREILNIEGEATYYVPTLYVPTYDSTAVEKLRESESIQLFAERASLALSSFQVTTENAGMIVNICRKVDGIPLAIELAAARVNILHVKEISKQLDDSFALLVSGSRGKLSRHETLQASMDWSWSLLSTSEQIFLRQLSVFAGGWTLESAQAVCEGNALNLISALMKKSLIIVDRKPDDQTRYRFHEIVRQYVYERLVESDEEENTRNRHLKYFLQFSGQAETALQGPTQMEWYMRLNEERDNIRAALGWADETDVEAAMYISARLQRFWEMYDSREGSYWLSKFLQKPESHVYPKARANALRAHGWILVDLQQFDVALSSAQECLELYRALGDQRGEVDGLLQLAWESSSVPEKMTLIQQALTLAKGLGDIPRQADALWQLGWLDQDNRFIYWEKAIALARPLGNWRGLAVGLSTIGYFLVLDGDIESAQKYLDEAVKLCQQVNMHPLPEGLLSAYGQIALLQGDFEKARTCFQADARLGVESVNRQHYLWPRTRLGYVALHEGNFTEACDIFAETAQEFQKDKYTIGVVFTLEGIAGTFVAMGKPQHAARIIGWTDAARKEIDDRRPILEQADVDKTIAACLAKLGKVAFSDAYDEGQKMSLEEAVAYALGESE